MSNDQKAKRQQSKNSRKGAVEDIAISVLQDQLRESAQNDSNSSALWVADEHPHPASLFSDLAQTKAVFLSNRFDQYQAAKNAGAESYFSDIDLSVASDHAVKNIFSRVAKERPLVHWVINEAFNLLPAGGSLWLSGYKNEGIKTHITRAETAFGAKAEVTRYKSQLLKAKLTKQENTGTALDNENYSILRQVETGGFSFWTKPGLYGWNKVDQGSKLLMDFLEEQSISFAGKKILDLGCGYGYLSMRAIDLGAENIVATDNCAAALAACGKNLSEQNIQTEIVPSDAGSEVSGVFDMILCNPPFHQGFSTTSSLHEQFIEQTKRLLSPSGSAYYVVNQFLDIEGITEITELSYHEMNKTQSFKLVLLNKQNSAQKN